MCRVRAAYQRAYQAPIAGIAGDGVKIRRRDDEEPGWIWCEHSANGLAGWVPEAFLERRTAETAVLRRGYSAMELSVQPGQIVTIIETMAGWIWCVSDSGEAGWVPAENIELP
jgi:hypothetical protein